MGDNEMIKNPNAEELIRSGMSFVCAWCEHLWRVFAQNEGKEANCGMKCGGPMAHDVFPKYKGPLEGQLAKFCFVCGKDADAGVDIGGKGMIGVCSGHIPQLKEMLDTAPGKARPVVHERQILKIG